MTTIIRATQKNTVQPITYSGAFTDVTTGAVGAITVFSPASNVNGAYVEYIGFSGVVNGASSGNCTSVAFIAKASVPASNIDGDVIFRANTGISSGQGNSPPVNIQQGGRVKIDAGKGLYLNQTLPSAANASVCEKVVLYTLL